MCIGLANASHNWYLKIREKLSKLGGKSFKIGQGLFYIYKGQELISVIVLFTDDLICEGKQIFTQKIQDIFQIGYFKAKEYI